MAPPAPPTPTIEATARRGNMSEGNVNMFAVHAIWTAVPRTLLKVLDLPANWLNGLLNRRGVDWKFFREAHCSSVERVTQQADQPDACEHNARRGHTPRNLQSLQFHYQGIKQHRKKSRQDDRDANRARIVPKHCQQARDQYEEQNRDSTEQLIG
jgi:hypothetical protein